MATKRKAMSHYYIHCYNADLVGSQPVNDTARCETRLGRDGRLYRAEKNEDGLVIAEYRQMTQKESECFGFKTITT